MNKLRLPRRIPWAVPAALVLVAVVAGVACAGDDGDKIREVPIPAATRIVESQRPLTSGERAAVADFASQLQSIEDEWALFYEDFDTWMSGLTECLPSTAQEALREFAASYTSVASMAGTLPRTTTTNELADLVAVAADLEETSLRRLRDRWQPGNVALFEAVEQASAGGARAQSSVRDLIAAKQEELEEGPSAAEVEEMKKFSDDFDEIAEAWDDFHDDYAALAKRESRLEFEVLIARYGTLITQFREVVASIEDLSPSEINKDLVDMLLDTAEAELDALEFQAESVALGPEEESGMPEMEASNTSAPSPGIQVPRSMQISVPADQPTQEPPEGSPIAPPETAADEQGGREPPKEPEAMPGPTAPEEQLPTPVPERATTVVGGAEGLSPGEQLAWAIAESETVIQTVERSIEEVVENKSAEQLADLQVFVGEFDEYVAERNGFYKGFGDWRATNGGCDQVQVVAGLNEYSQRAAEVARSARGLPQTGLLLPVYVLVAEASERDANAMRTLTNTWTPFAVDSFRAVDEERVASGRLRRQASIALEELQSR